MKTVVSSYSFSSLTNNGSMTQLDTIAKAKEIGFDGIEFAGIQPHDGSSPAEYARKLRDESERVGLPILNYVDGADFLTGSDGDTAAEIKRVQGLVDIAEILGVSVMRHDCTGGSSARSFGAVLPVLADACREVTKYAEQKGIRTMVENHGLFCQDSIRVEQLADAVNHPNFGLLVDMGNFLCADDDPVTAVSRVAKQAFYVHAKDFIVKSGMEPAPGRPFFQSRGGNWLRGTIIGQGNVPVLQCITVMRKAGYDGGITIEFEGMEEPIEALTIGLENLRRYIAQADAMLSM